MYGIALTLHLLAATVWTGGHLVLALTILPNVLKYQDVQSLRKFEQGYEKIGIPALIIQVLSGIYLCFIKIPDFVLWFDFENPVARVICLKLGLLGLTMMLAVDARLRIIPNLSSHNLSSLAWHIIPVTLISVLFVIVGVSFRTGWFF